MEKKYLGRTEEHGELWLEKHKWDCGWYWGFGYIGNRRLHTHINSLLKAETDVNVIFERTKITQGKWWQIRELFLQAYTLKEAAALYRHGAHQTSLGGWNKLLADEGMAAKMNEHLKIVLDAVWELI